MFRSVQRNFCHKSSLWLCRDAIRPSTFRASPFSGAVTRFSHVGVNVRVVFRTAFFGIWSSWAASEKLLLTQGSEWFWAPENGAYLHKIAERHHTFVRLLKAESVLNAPGYSGLARQWWKLDLAGRECAGLHPHMHTGLNEGRVCALDLLFETTECDCAIN